MPSDQDLMAKILAEPATSKIADSLGISIEEYAARVLFYIKNPKADPQLNVLTPEQEKAAGVPSMAEAVTFINKLHSGEIPLEGEHERTRFAGFDDDEKSAVNAAGGTAKREAPKAAPTTAPSGPVVAKRGLSKK